MKTPTTLILCAVAVLAFVAVQPIQAAVYTWNTGTENWDTVTSNWTGAGATWVNGNDAVFGGTASSTITINEAGITVNKVTFNVDGDTIAASGGNDLTLSGGNDIVVGTGLTADISAPIVGNVGLEKLGGGKLILSGASTYTGTTHVKEGTLECGINDALPTGANVLMGWGSNSGTPTLDATLDIGNFTATINNITWGYDQQHKTQTVTTGASGLLTLTGDILRQDTHSRGIKVISGNLELSAKEHYINVLPTGSDSSLTISANVSGAGGFKLNAYNLTLSGVNTYTGDTRFVGSGANSAQIGVASVGTVGSIVSGPFGTGTLIFENGGICSDGATARTILNAVSFTNNGAIGDATRNGKMTFSAGVDLGGSGRTITVNSDAQFDGIITNGGLTKAGAGTLILTNTGNNYTSGTGVTAGILRTGASNVIPDTGSLAIGATGTIDLNGNSDTVGSIYLGVGSAGQLASITTGAGTLTLAGDINKDSNSWGDHLISGNLDLGNATRTIKIGTGSNLPKTLTISANVSGGTGAGITLTDSTNCTLVLSGTNTFDGPTAVNSSGSMLVYGSAASFGSAAGRHVTVANNAGVAAGYAIDNAFLNHIVENGNTSIIALGADSANNLDFGSAAGATLSGASLGATGAYTYSGTLTPNSTTYRLGGGGGTLIMSQPDAVTGAGYSLEVKGNVTLSADNDYDTGTTLTTGTLAVGDDDALGSGALVMNGGRLSSDSATAHTIGNAVTLGGNVTLGNATNNGKLTFSNTVDLGGATRTLTLSSDAQFDGIISGAGGITKAGAGTLTPTQANTYTGPTTVNAGVLAVASLANGGVAGTIGQSSNAASNLVLGGGTLQYTGATASIDRNMTLTGGTNTVDITGAAANLTLPGATGSGSGSLIKDGAGTLTFSAQQGYTGTTTVSAGTLALAGGDHTLVVNKALVVDGTLDLGANNQYVGDLTGTGAITGSGTLTTNLTANRTFDGVIGGSVNLTKVDGSTLTLTADNTTTGTVKVIGTGLTLKDSGTLLNISGGIPVNNATLNIDNSGTSNLADRVKDAAAITLNGGNLTFTGTSTAASETLGAVTANSGYTTLNVPTKAAASTLTLTSLSRTSGTLINITSGNNGDLGQGGTKPALFVTGDTAGMSANLVPINNVVPGAYHFRNSDSIELVNYVSGLGFGYLGQTGFGAAPVNGSAGSGATDNVKGGWAVPAGGQTINSLTGAGTFTFSSSTDTLTINSGMIVNPSQNNATFGTTTTRGKLTSGTSELFLVRYNGNGTPTYNTINSVVTDNGNPVKFIITGDYERGDDRYWPVLTAQNTYSGGTVISVVTVELRGTTAGDVVIPAGGLTLNNGGKVQMYTNAGQIHPDNIVTINGGGTLNLTGANNTLAGIVFNSNGGTATPTVTGGTQMTITGDIASTPTNVAVTPLISVKLDLNGSDAHDITVAALPEGNLVNNGAIPLALNGLKISSVIQNGGFTKKGAGVLNLTGNNTFAGQLTVEEGVLNVATVNNSGAAGPLGQSALSVIMGGSTGTLEYTGNSVTSDKPFTMATGGTGAFQVDKAGQTLTLSGLIDGGGNLDKTGLGNLILSNAGNNYSGATFVSQGTLSITNAYLSDTAAVKIASGALMDLDFGAAYDTVGDLWLGGVQKAPGDYNYTTDPTFFTAASTTSWLRLLASLGNYWAPEAGGGGSETWDSTATFWATTSGTQGTLGQADGLLYFTDAAGTVTVNGTVTADAGLKLETTGYDLVAGASTPNINLAGATPAANTVTTDPGVTATIGVDLTGSNGMTKAGTGTLALGGANTYTGATNVDEGTLLVNGSLDLNSTVTVASGATLGGTGTISGPTFITGSHTPGTSAGIQTFDGNLTYNDTSDVTWELTANTSTNQANPNAVFDQVVVNADLNFPVAGTTTLNLKFNSDGSVVDWTDALWNTSQSWLVYQVGFSTNNIGNLKLAVADWQDSLGASFDTAHPGMYFYRSQSGEDVMLNFLVPGDASLDKNTNALDYVVVSNHYGAGSPTWADGDVNYDGFVDALDYVVISNNYGSHAPEPATLAILTMGGAWLAFRRRRHGTKKGDGMRNALKKMGRLGAAVLALVMAAGVCQASVTANLSLAVDQGTQTWSAYLTLTDTSSETLGLSGVYIDVWGSGTEYGPWTGGLDVDSATSKLPSGYALIGGSGTTQGFGASAAGTAVDTGYELLGSLQANMHTADATYDNILVGVGKVAGSAPSMIPATIVWAHPVLVAEGTYTGTEGWINVSLRKGTDPAKPEEFGKATSVTMLPDELPASGVTFATSSPMAGDDYRASFFVPEPATLALLGLGGLGVLLRRKRR